mmetsp:Transcript_345/g.677  ORF Transcript_345/g.677 Transcript_345/m.677 type:complete len:90 (+) Transcript_345:266-535(+)
MFGCAWAVTKGAKKSQITSVQIERVPKDRGFLTGGVGDLVGSFVGWGVGLIDGSAVGLGVGCSDGGLLGCTVGLFVMGALQDPTNFQPV